MVSSLLGVDSISMQQFIFISVFGGVLAGLVLLIVNVIVANIGFRRNWDIDNVSAPLITAAGDIVTLPMLFLAGIIVLNWNGSVAEIFYDVAMVAFLVITVYLIYEAMYRRDEEAKRIFVQSSPVLVICILLDLGAGLTIEGKLSHLVAFPALLVLIPLFLQNSNALGGISPPACRPCCTWVSWSLARSPEGSAMRTLPSSTSSGFGCSPSSA